MARGPRKPTAPPSISGNRYSSPAPRRRNPNIAGTYKFRPKDDPRYEIKKRGGGLGYVRVLKKPTAPKTTAPKPPPGPYDRYKETAPWAIPGLEQIDRDQESHQNYVSRDVMPWLSTSLAGVQGFQDAAMNQYLQGIQGNQGAYGVAAAMTPLNVQGSPGGMVAAPNAYQTQAGTTRASGLGSAATAIAQNQALMGKLAPVPLTQGFINSLADYAKGLPTLYTEKRRAYTEKVDQFIAQAQADAAKAAETERHNRVMEAIGATNAESGAAIAFGRLGLDTEKFGAESAADAAAAGAPAPYGYARDPASGRLVRDPSIPTASASGGGGGGGGKPLTASTIADMQGKWKRPRNSPPKLGPGWKQPVWDPRTKAWYAKRASGGSAPKAPKVGSKAFDVQKDLIYSLDNGFIDDTDQNKGTGDLLRFLRKHQPQSPAAFNKWWADIIPVLRDQDPDFVQWMVGYVQRRRKDGTWKGRF